MIALAISAPALLFVAWLAWSGLVLDHEEHKRTLDRMEGGE